MTTAVSRAIAALLMLMLGAATAAPSARAGAEKVAFPAGYPEWVRYTTVDKPDRGIVRFFYVNPDALARAERGRPLPHGTVLVMEDHKAETRADGSLAATAEVTNVFVMEKQAGWGAEYPDEVRNGEWEYARFLADGSRKPGAEFDRCFACHKPQAEQDFTFTFYPAGFEAKD